jgi:hypothetical protein
MDSLKYHSGPACPTFQRPVSEPPSTAGRAACGHLLPFWTPHAVHLWPTLTLESTFESDATRSQLLLPPGAKLLLRVHHQRQGLAPILICIHESSADDDVLG